MSATRRRSSGKSVSIRAAASYGHGFRCAKNSGSNLAPDRFTYPAALIPGLWLANRSSGVRSRLYPHKRRAYEERGLDFSRNVPAVSDARFQQHHIDVVAVSRVMSEPGSFSVRRFTEPTPLSSMFLAQRPFDRPSSPVAFQRGKHHFAGLDDVLEVAMRFGAALQAFDEAMHPGLKGMVLDTSGIRLHFPHLRPSFHREPLASIRGQK